MCYSCSRTPEKCRLSQVLTTQLGSGCRSDLSRNCIGAPIGGELRMACGTCGSLVYAKFTPLNWGNAKIASKICLGQLEVGGGKNGVRQPNNSDIQVIRWRNRHRGETTPLQGGTYAPPHQRATH